MSNEASRHEDLQRLFQQAEHLDAAGRAELLAQVAREDAELALRLGQLLEHDHSSPGALDVPAVGALGMALSKALVSEDLARDQALPQRIGPYRILGLLGRGGMGVVYEAEQESTRRRVALKVLRPDLATPGMLRRFEHETLVLGWLNHPGIAQIYDAGTADAGHGPQPYLAMELVRGLPLSPTWRKRG
ncbi:MAG: hypothetical protein R3E96_15400 [Planctomycetota bacterium]